MASGGKPALPTFRDGREHGWLKGGLRADDARVATVRLCPPVFDHCDNDRDSQPGRKSLAFGWGFGGSVYDWSDRLLWHFLVEVCARVKLFTSQPEKGGKEEIKVLASLQTHPSDLNPPTSPQLLQILPTRFCHIVGWRISLLLLELWGPHLWTPAEVLLACS